VTWEVPEEYRQADHPSRRSEAVPADGRGRPKHVEDTAESRRSRERSRDTSLPSQPAGYSKRRGPSLSPASTSRAASAEAKFIDLTADSDPKFQQKRTSIPRKELTQQERVDAMAAAEARANAKAAVVKTAGGSGSRRPSIGRGGTLHQHKPTATVVVQDSAMHQKLLATAATRKPSHLSEGAKASTIPKVSQNVEKRNAKPAEQSSKEDSSLMAQIAARIQARIEARTGRAASDQVGPTASSPPVQRTKNPQNQEKVAQASRSASSTKAKQSTTKKAPKVSAKKDSVADKRKLDEKDFHTRTDFVTAFFSVVDPFLFMKELEAKEKEPSPKRRKVHEDTPSLSAGGPEKKIKSADQQTSKAADATPTFDEKLETSNADHGDAATAGMANILSPKEKSLSGTKRSSSSKDEITEEEAVQVAPCGHPFCPKASLGKSMFCFAHGGGFSCQHLGCPRLAEIDPGFCRKHAKRCEHEGCYKRALGITTLCKAHAADEQLPKEKKSRADVDSNMIDEIEPQAQGGVPSDEGASKTRVRTPVTKAQSQGQRSSKSSPDEPIDSESNTNRRRSNRAAAETAKVALSFMHGNIPSPARSPSPDIDPEPQPISITRLFVSVGGHRLDDSIDLTSEKDGKVDYGSDNEGLQGLVELLERKGKVKIAAVVLQTTNLVEDAIRLFPWCWPESSADHSGLVSTALQAFSRDVILPAMRAQNESEIRNPVPVILGTLLFLREVMIQNAAAMFGETAFLTGTEEDFEYRDQSEAEHAVSCQGQTGLFSASTVVTSIIIFALDKVKKGNMTDKFMRLMDAYDDGDEEFSSLLGPLDPSKGALLPGGKSMDETERDMWQASYNNRAENHPATLKQRLRESGVPVPPAGIAAVAPANAVHLTLLELPEPNEMG